MQKESTQSSIDATLLKGVQEVIGHEELAKKLAKKQKLIIKAGFDPTAKDLHLGHTVLINKLKQFQDLGHEIIFLIGDFTAQIGDPTGRNQTRPALSQEEILKNSQTYQNQVFKILDPNKTQVRYNSEWLSQLSAIDLIKLTSQYTVARMLERDDFHKRFKNNQSLSIHEFLYPILQGWDSVVLKADVEIGGTDQKFNLLMGRHYQKLQGQEPQAIMTLPLLEGTCGDKKMSKSYDNFIGIQESPQNIYGKLMSISDELMWRYFDLLSFEDIQTIQRYKTAVTNQTQNPKEIKEKLAFEIVARFHGVNEAQKASEGFHAQFSQNKIPDDIPIYSIQEPTNILDLLVDCKLTKSKSEARRLVEQGAVRINQEKITNISLEISPDKESIIQVGKRRFIKVS